MRLEVEEMFASSAVRPRISAEPPEAEGETGDAA
jgi:hypothetical protein